MLAILTHSPALPAACANAAQGRPRILIASWLRWVSSARLAASLVERGAEVYSLCPSFHPLSAVRGVAGRAAYRATAPAQSIRAAILRFQPDLIIPCDDDTTMRMRRLLERCRDSSEADDLRIAGVIERSFGSVEALATCTSRAPLLEAARAAGVRTPPGQAIASWPELAAWVANNGLPAFLKRDGTNGGNGVREVRDIEAARAAWRRLSSPPSLLEAIKCLIKQQDFRRIGEVLTRRRGVVSIQAAIEGRPANCLAVCKDGELLAYIGVEVSACLKPTGFGTVITASDNADMQNAARQIAEHLHLSGVFGLDFIIKEGTNEAYLIEMNPRVTPLAHFQFGPGRDPAAALCALVTGHPEQYEQPGAPPSGAIAVFPHMLTSLPALPQLLVDAPWDQPELMRLAMPLPSNPLAILSELISRFLL